MSAFHSVAGLTDEEQRALEHFTTTVRAHYGNRLHNIVLFGSRARGDFHDDSDVDLAIILADGDWDYWTEKTRVGDWAADALIDHGLFIQPWPVAVSNWEHPERYANMRFVRAARLAARTAPSPLVGEGWGGGYANSPTLTQSPHPVRPHKGEGTTARGPSS